MALIEELSKVRPDLIPALTFDPRSELSILLDAEESLLDEASLESTATWKNRAIEVVARVTGVKHKPEDITPIKTGQNVVSFFHCSNSENLWFHLQTRDTL